MLSNNRRQAILRHIGRYAVTLRPVLDRLFFGGTPDGCKNDLAALLKEKFVQTMSAAVPDGEGRNLAYYWLTKRSTHLVGVPTSRSMPVTPAALDRNLAYLWFCCMTETRRYRLEKKDLVDIFGADGVKSKDNKGLKLSGLHCLEERGDSHYCVYQLYRTTTPRDQCIREIRHRLDTVTINRAVRRWIASQQYGFAVITETPGKEIELRDAIQAQEFANVRFIVASAPGLWK
jgi:hypothetical protein